MGRQMTRDGLEHDMGIELKNTVYREGEGIPVVLVHGFPVITACGTSAPPHSRESATSTV